MGLVHSNRQSTPVAPPLLEGEQVGRCHGSQHRVCRRCTGALAVAACDAMSCSVVQCGPVWRRVVHCRVVQNGLMVQFDAA